MGKVRWIEARSGTKETARSLDTENDCAPDTASAAVVAAVDCLRARQGAEGKDGARKLRELGENQIAEEELIYDQDVSFYCFLLYCDQCANTDSSVAGRWSRPAS